MKNPSVTVILPTYNEAENIIPLIRELLKYLPTSAEILVVDDESPDHTAELVKSFCQINRAERHVKFLVRKKNHGLTSSLKDGIVTSTSQVVIWMDCDFSHPPVIVPKLIEAINSGADLALASRFITTNLKDSPRKNHSNSAQLILSRGLNSFISLIFGSGITDYTTGFLAARRKVLNKIPLRGDYGEYCIDFLIRARNAGYQIVEIPYSSPPRLHGESKTAPNLPVLIRHGYGYLKTLVRVFWELKLTHIWK